MTAPFLEAGACWWPEPPPGPIISLYSSFLALAGIQVCGPWTGWTLGPPLPLGQLPEAWERGVQAGWRPVSPTHPQLPEEGHGSLSATLAPPGDDSGYSWTRSGAHRCSSAKMQIPCRTMRQRPHLPFAYLQEILQRARAILLPANVTEPQGHLRSLCPSPHGYAGHRGWCIHPGSLAPSNLV